MTSTNKETTLIMHEHRRAEPSDFQGKTISRFEPSADNIWRFWFSDGTAVAIQSDSFGPYRLACMELCEVCANDD